MRKLFYFLLSLSAIFYATDIATARDASEHWVQVRTPHFQVITDTNDKQAQRVAGQFERMRTVFQKLIPGAADSAGSPIVVLALRDKKAFQELEPEAYLAKGTLNLAGLFLRAPDKNYILLRLDAEGDHPYATVYHEYTHYMLRKDDEWLPLWLNEGLAEFYQNSDIREKEVLVGEPSADDILYLRQNRLLPLTTLLAVDHSSPYYHDEQKGSVFYSESWALTHYLTMHDRQNHTEQLRAYAVLLLKKQDPVSAAQQAFGDLKQLQKALDGYISRSDFSMFKMDAAIAVDASAFTTKPMTNADADAIRADVLVYDERTKDAQALLETTLRDNPDNALAHETMGYLKFREGDIPAAAKWYGEAVKLDSQSYLAHYYYGAMQMQSMDRSHDEQIEASLMEANKLNPGFAPAFDSLAMFYGMRHKNLEEAHMLNLKAIQIEPENLNYRLNAANILMDEEQYSSAVGVLKESQRLVKNDEERARVSQRIAEVQNYEAEMDRIHSDTRAGTRPETRTTIMAGADSSQVTVMVKHEDAGPKYPTEEPTGAKHKAKGVLRSVHCSYPTVITMNIDQGGKMIALYRNDYFKIDFTATNFTPQGNLDPCSGIEGMKVSVEYAEVSDKSIAGQVLSVELSK